LPKEIKERIKEFIPADVIGKIPTEEETKTIDELKAFLEKQGHPVVKRWAAEETEEASTEVAEGEEVATTMVPMSTATMSAGGFKIIFKNAKIHAEKIIIKRENPKTKR
jgi:acetyl-CoA decarbonylase/synthase complex subunit beta